MRLSSSPPPWPFSLFALKLPSYPGMGKPWDEKGKKKSRNNLQPCLAGTKQALASILSIHDPRTSVAHGPSRYNRAVGHRTSDDLRFPKELVPLQRANERRGS